MFKLRLPKSDQRTQNGDVQDAGRSSLPSSLIYFISKFQVAQNQVDRRQLPLATERIVDHDIDLRAVEAASPSPQSNSCAYDQSCSALSQISGYPCIYQDSSVAIEIRALIFLNSKTP